MADLHRHILDMCSPSRHSFLHFHAVFKIIWSNNRLVFSPLGNSGSATVNLTKYGLEVHGT